MSKHTIAVIGLGYVGLPLAIALAEKHRVIGFDTSPERISELLAGTDHTLEAETQQLTTLLNAFQKSSSSAGIIFSHNARELAECNIYIIAVPTPVDASKQPDLSLLKAATRTAALTLNKNDIVIYESTVYPGCTEEVGVPILEKVSGLTFNHDFYCGYSPERINPGDRNRTIHQIRKITSGSTPGALDTVDQLYASFITAGTYPVSSIKVAEAAKVIENTQRDINIAFVNELAKIFSLMNINTGEVLKAAATKWNFLPFEPGLVGGHCIGIDPYYLAFKAQALGFQPDMILTARKMNDSMGEFVASQVTRLMAGKKILRPDAEVLIMGIAFKENFADVRNSKVVDIIHALTACHLKVTIFDPVVSPEAVRQAYTLDCIQTLEPHKKYSAVIVAVNHAQFMAVDYAALLLSPGVLFDVKGLLDTALVDGSL